MVYDYVNFVSIGYVKWSKFYKKIKKKEQQKNHHGLKLFRLSINKMRKERIIFQMAMDGSRLRLNYGCMYYHM